MNHHLSSENSKIAEWYNGKNVLITGATGFMGKVLVEKILYVSPNVEGIYVLVRQKKGQFPNQRIKEMFELPMFERLKKSNPKAIDKVIPVIGDVTLENLGLKFDDKEELINKINVVFHLAATTAFNKNLYDAVNMNVLGTERILNLCKMMKHLDVFVHLSTCFCSVEIPLFKEKVYENPISPENVISVAKNLKGDILDMITTKLMEPHPNTYTFTKRLAEDLVDKGSDGLKVAIVRPSIVVPAVKEPTEGWVDALTGPIGILVGGGKGVIRSMHCNGQYKACIIPVDFAINALIVIGWKIGSSKKRSVDVPVFNVTNGDDFYITWTKILTLGKKYVYDIPFENTIWYPDGDIRDSKIVHLMYTFFFHWLPAYLLDFILLLIGKKRFMVRLQRKIHSGLELLQYFTTREWKFDNKEFNQLWNSDMDEKDKQIFNMDCTSIKLEEYMKNCVFGARLYCLKESASSIPRCRIQIKILYVIHKLVVYLFYAGMFYLMYKLFSNVL